MKRILSFCLLITAITSSCNNTEKQTATSTTTEIKETDKETIIDHEKILGSYVGNFGTNKITLLITKATTDSIEGRSVVGGNDRPFIGTVNFDKGIYTFSAKEPGDNKHDGVFEFKIDKKNTSALEGTWVPNTTTETITPKVYSLTRRAFVYSTDNGGFPEASQRLLKEEDVNNLMKSELELMRNEIFARHGYCFKKKNLRDLFENEDWYVPHTVDIRNDLTEIERKNIVLIKKYEKYADEYGDDFGR